LSTEEREALLRDIQSEFRTSPRRFSLHAVMEATADRLPVGEVIRAIVDPNAEIIEDYPDDPRGRSCLILGWPAEGGPIHVVVSYPPDPAVITVYRPDPERWVEYRERK